MEAATIISDINLSLKTMENIVPLGMGAKRKGSKYLAYSLSEWIQ